MAGAARTSTSDLEIFQALADEPYRFGYFQALRRLECAKAGRPRFGKSIRLSDDPIRLGQTVTLAFAPSTLSNFEPGTEGRPPRLRVLFFGMFGPNGPLPLHLTEYARSRLKDDKDPTFIRFMDVFHHRMLCLFYRGWATAQPTVSFDRPDDDPFGNYVASLFGLGLPALRDRDALPDLAKLHFAGRLGCQTKNPEGLVAFCSTYFDTPVRLDEFVGQWITLPRKNRCRIGESRTTGLLGKNVIVGARIWDFRQKFRLVLGPMGWEQFCRLLPGGESLPRLIALVRTYIGDELMWDANLVLKKEEVPKTQLGSLGQIGLTTWLITDRAAKDADDVVLCPMDYVKEKQRA